MAVCLEPGDINILDLPEAWDAFTNTHFYLVPWVLDRHKLTVFYLNSFAMDSVQVGKAVFVK